MVRRHWGRWALALGLGLVAGATARGDAISNTGTATSPIFATGNVETDMPAGSSSVTVIPGHDFGYTAQPQWMTDAGLVNGYAMKDIRLSYDKTTDTLAVGVNFFGVAGNTDGSPDGQTNAMTLQQHGSNPANFGLDKSISVAIAPVNSAGGASTPLVVAGIPAIKADPSGTPADKFTVAAFQNSAGGLTQSYGQTLAANVGTLAYDPSSAHPDFEFTIKNFSKIPGLNALSKGFYISAYAGSQQTIIVGKSDIANTFVSPNINPPLAQLPTPGINPPGSTPVYTPTPPPRTQTPEPTTVLAWGLIIGGSAWRIRRRRLAQP